MLQSLRPALGKTQPRRETHASPYPRRSVVRTIPKPPCQDVHIRTCSHVVRSTETANQFDVDKSKPEKLSDEELGSRDDDALPNSLADAVSAAAASTALAINRGNDRTQVELLLPEFWDPQSGPMFPNAGDQERFWKITKRFSEDLAQACQMTNVKVIYPDAGVAAMLANQWGTDVKFQIASLNDRRPISKEDELIVIACPDPFGADDCLRIIRQVGEQDEAEGTLSRPIVLFNQRLSSADVGIGLNARRLRERILNRFTITYSLRPIADVGTVFKKYPGIWQVFVEDENLPGRYKLVAERPTRPAADQLDLIITQALNPQATNPDGSAKPAGFMDQLVSVARSMQTFMRSLSN